VTGLKLQMDNPRATEAMAPPRTSVLVVDDDPDLLRLMQIRLDSAGYRVTTAESAERALALISVARPQVVVTDLRMSGMDGIALFEAIHAHNPTLPVIILTAHGTIPDAVAAVKRGVFGYLTKPFDAIDYRDLCRAAYRPMAGTTSE